MTAEEPLNLRCSAAVSTTAVILAEKKCFFFIMNKSNKIIGFIHYKEETFFRFADFQNLSDFKNIEY